MRSTRLGRTLVIANPAAHSGKGAAGAEAVRRFLEVYESATGGFEVKLTESPGDAVRFAQQAGEYDTVIALGGDGVIHEVVNGLMALDASARPCLGVIPLGSGNDFARTLHLTLNNPDRSLAELLAGGERSIDVGHVRSDRNPAGCYFVETLSFGFDAAVAIDTTAHRAQGTRQQGAGLFVTSTLRMLGRVTRQYPCTVRIDGGEPFDLGAIIFAIQNGPTYGGGFRICPQALPADGWLDCVYNVRRPWLGHILVLLGLVRFGRHTNSAALHLGRLRCLSIDFLGEEPPCQVDGEEFGGSHLKVEVHPKALRVIVPPAVRW